VDEFVVNSVAIHFGVRSDTPLVSAPFQGLIFPYGPLSQGFALSWLSAPLWGFRSVLIGARVGVAHRDLEGSRNSVTYRLRCGLHARIVGPL
jgi:hypothetical protein